MLCIFRLPRRRLHKYGKRTEQRTLRDPQVVLIGTWHKKVIRQSQITERGYVQLMEYLEPGLPVGEVMR
jgi:hypothetical protein